MLRSEFILRKILFLSVAKKFVLKESVFFLILSLLKKLKGLFYKTFLFSSSIKSEKKRKTDLSLPFRGTGGWSKTVP